MPAIAMTGRLASTANASAVKSLLLVFFISQSPSELRAGART